MRFCRECGNLTEDEVCAICLDARRDRTIVCVVEQPVDLLSIERTAEYRGLYHVLGGALSPIDGVEPEHLRIDELLRRVERNGIEEVVLATNPNMTGEATAAYLADRLRGRVARDAPRERAARGRRPRVRGRGHARPRAHRAAARCDDDDGRDYESRPGRRRPGRRRAARHGRDEVRRHLGRRPGAAQGGRAALVARARARATASSPSSRRWATRPTTSSRSRTRSRRGRSRASSTCSSRSASGSRARSRRWRSTISATRRSRSPARRRASSPTRRTARRRSSTSARQRIHEALDDGRIVLVAGFQGVSTDLDITTLGRGGSDTTAVALAAALGAEVVRDLHRRRGRLHRRPAARARGAQAPRA